MRVEEDNAPDTYIKKSDVAGYGLFASKHFKKGEKVIDYNLFPDSWYKLLYSDLSAEQISKNWYIMLDEAYCLTNDKLSKFSYINHSRNANCEWLVADRLVIAKEDIVVDAELFIDYRLEPRPNRQSYPEWI
jgi:SET domain-containing protein